MAADRMRPHDSVAASDSSRYRWVLVGAGALVMAFQAGLVAARAVFVAAIPEESGWSRTETSAAISALALGTGLWAPLAGHAVQQWGPRRTMTVSALIVGGGMIAASQARGPLELGLWLLLLVAPGSMGMGTLANFAAIQACFVARRGLALALADSGSSLGIILVVPATQVLIELFGWRGALLALGLTALLLAPFNWLLQRSPPAPLLEAAVRPRSARSAGPSDGRSGAGPARGHTATSTEPQEGSVWTLIRTTRFVVLASGMSGIWLSQQIVTTHQAAYLTDHGYDAVSIGTSYALIGLTGLAGRPAFGWLSDRLGASSTFGLLMVGLVGGIGALVLAGDGRVPLALWLFGVTMGASLGVGTLLFARQVTTHFGQQRFGTVMGLCYFFGCAIGAAGATLAGLARDLSGTYVPSFGVAALAALLSLLCVWLLNRAPRPASASA